MLARLRRPQVDRQAGFTLVELLVVMVIVAVLAAIAIPLFLTQRDKARETAAESDVTTVGKGLASYYVDGTGASSVSTSSGRWNLYPNAAGSGTASDSGRLSGGVTVTGSGTGDTDWCVVGDNAQMANPPLTVWAYTAKEGLIKGSTTAYGTGTISWSTSPSVGSCVTTAP